MILMKDYIDYASVSSRVKRSLERAMDLVQDAADRASETVVLTKDLDVTRDLDYAEQYISSIKENIREMDSIVNEMHLRYSDLVPKAEENEEDTDNDCGDCDDCEDRDVCYPDVEETTTTTTETEEEEELDSGFMTDAQNIHFTFTDNATLNIIFGGLE